MLESDEEVNEFPYYEEYMETINGTDRRVVETKLAQYQKSPRAKAEAQIMKSGDNSDLSDCSKSNKSSKT